MCQVVAYGITGFLPKKSKYRYKNYITVKLIQCTIQIYNDPIDPFSGNFCIGTYMGSREIFRKYFYQSFERFQPPLMTHY